MVRGFFTAIVLVALAYAVSFLLFVSLLPFFPFVILQRQNS